MIVITMCPDAGTWHDCVKPFADERLESVHDQCQAVVCAQFHQSVPMVRHQYPAKWPGVAPCVGLDHHATDNSCQIGVAKPWHAVGRDRRQQIEPSGLGHSPLAQCLMASGICHAPTILLRMHWLNRVWTRCAPTGGASTKPYNHFALFSAR